MRSVSLTALILALALPLSAGAQLGGIGATGTTDSFTLSIDDQYPAPYSRVAVSISSDSLDLAGASLSVSVGGKEIYKGSARTFAVTLGGSGSITVVKATVVYQGATYSQSLSIQPQDVALVAEPIASVPPLYPGNPSIPMGGNVRLVAVANLRDTNGKTSGAAGYAYSWTVDDTKAFNASGIGKSSIIVAAPLQYRDSKISVDVRSPDGKLVGGTSFTLSAGEPSVRIYENDPLLGIRYEHALTGSYAIKGAESTLYAAPFSFPMTDGAPLVQWYLNGSLAQTGSLITLRPAGSGEGTASLSLTASSGSSDVSQGLSLLFGGAKSTNIFGL